MQTNIHKGKIERIIEENSDFFLKEWEREKVKKKGQINELAKQCTKDYRKLTVKEYTNIPKKRSNYEWRITTKKFR